jgi:D-threo-aldose 1-dehydrogenase
LKASEQTADSDSAGAAKRSRHLSRSFVGTTGVEVTRLGLGTAPLGGLFETVPEEDALEAVASAYSSGLSLFDTAPLYGCGVAELRVGAALSGKPRNSFVLSTKVGRTLEPRLDADPRGGEESLFVDRAPFRPVFDFSHSGVMRSVHDSLERLGLEELDIVHLHDPDADIEQAVTEAFAALTDLRNQGLLRAIGVGTNSAATAAEVVRRCDVDCVLIAGRYSLLDQSSLDELFPVCESKHVSVIVGGVYNSGILTGSGALHYDYAAPSHEVQERTNRIATIGAEYDVLLRAAAVQFPLGHPSVASVLVGCRSAAELTDNVAVLNQKIPPEFWAHIRREGLLDPRSPTPGQAP